MRIGPYTLRVNITTIFTLLILVISAVTVFYIYEKNSRSVLSLANELIDRTGKQIVERSEAFFHPVGAAVSGLAVLGRDQESLARSGRLFPLLTTLLQEYPQLQSLYFAFQSDGDFLQAYAVPPDVRRYGPNDTPTHPDTAFALRTLRRHVSPPTDEWVYLDKAGRELGREFAQTVSYDARSRPWYLAATQEEQLLWSDITIFTSTQLPGLTPAHPIFRDGQLIGAAAANMTLDRIADFLAELEVGRNGVAFFMDRETRLIAYPDRGKAVRREGEKFVQTRADEVGNPWVAEAVRRYRAGQRERFSFEFSGSHYMAAFTDMPATFAKPWVIAIVVPTDDFVGELKRTNVELLVIVLATTLIGILLVGLFARLISQPLTEMAAEADKIRRFDLAEDIHLNSRIMEIQRLSDALAAMKAAMHAFARYVPRELVRDLMASGQALKVGGQTRHLTVMFTDVRGFTGIAEKLPAHELLQHISEHFDVATRLIMETGGTVDKFIGDSVMAFWGAPNLVEEQGARACRAALAIRDQMAVLNETWQREGKPTLFIRFGIHADTVVIGNVGSAERLSYTAFGDGVVVAQRLEGLNKNYGTQICVSQTIYREVGDRFLMRPLDFVVVKGRRAPLLVYELLGEKSATSSALEAMAFATRQAFDAYMGKNWQAALDGYGALAVDYPDDPLYPLFVERCRYYLARPPVNDWNGLFARADD